MRKQIQLQIEVEDTPIYFDDLERSDRVVVRLTYDLWKLGRVSDVELLEQYSFYPSQWMGENPGEVHKIHLSILQTQTQTQPRPYDAVLGGVK